MTEEELARFVLLMRKAERVRVQVAKDEAVAGADGGSDSLQIFNVS
jgi:hypothetical protein